jgi:hypothetical protein
MLFFFLGASFILIGNAISKDKNLFYYNNLHSSSWILNRNQEFSKIFSILTDILTSEQSNLERWIVSFYNIPKYDHMLSQIEINSRSENFSSGSSILEHGKTYSFGSDVGYSSYSCHLNYWPDGNYCPVPQKTTVYFSLAPKPEIAPGFFRPRLLLLFRQ